MAGDQNCSAAGLRGQSTEGFGVAGVAEPAESAQELSAGRKQPADCLIC